MPETLIFRYPLTKELWRRFYEAHYGCDPSLKWCYLAGGLCIVIASCGFGGLYPSRLVAALLLFTGFVGVLCKPLLVARALRSARRHPFFGRELTVAVSPEEVSMRCGTAGYSQPWDNFVGYRRLAPGFLLYQDRHAFLFLPLAVMTAGQARQVEQTLGAAGVPPL